LPGQCENAEDEQMLLARQSGASKDEPEGRHFSHGADSEAEQVDPTSPMLSYSHVPGEHDLDVEQEFPPDGARPEPNLEPGADDGAGYWDWDSYDHAAGYQDLADFPDHDAYDEPDGFPFRDEYHDETNEVYDDHESSMTWMAREGFAMFRPVALQFEESAVRFMGRWSIRAAEISLGVIYIWFGILKFFPDLSPAEGLVKETAAALTDAVGVPLPLTPTLVMLAAWEVGVGALYMAGLFRRVVIWLVLAHLVATGLPFLLLPDVVWTKIPFGLTLVGQYIVKNLVLVAAALAIGAATRARSQSPAESY
jgi:uncharacterized membrane protein YkgB